jgi:hypothetical protein
VRLTGAFFTNSLMEAGSMRTIVRLARVRTLVSFVAALCFATGIATAGEWAHDYEFTLPCRAYWNSIPLRAGNYTFTLDRYGLDTQVILRREGKAVAILLTSYGFSNEGSSAADALMLTPRGGTYYVSALSLAGRNLTLRYQAPKTAGRSQVREAMRRVPILAASR